MLAGICILWRRPVRKPPVRFGGFAVASAQMDDVIRVVVHVDDKAFRAVDVRRHPVHAAHRGTQGIVHGHPLRQVFGVDRVLSSEHLRH